MKNILRAIDEFILELKTYEQFFDTDISYKPIPHLIKVIVDTKELIEKGAFELIKIVTGQAARSEKSTKKYKTETIEDETYTFLEKLYVACDSYNSLQVLDPSKDSVITYLQTIKSGLHAIIKEVKKSKSITLSVFKKDILSELNKYLYFFHALALMRKHNLAFVELIQIQPEIKRQLTTIKEVEDKGKKDVVLVKLFEEKEDRADILLNKQIPKVIKGLSKRLAFGIFSFYNGPNKLPVAKTFKEIIHTLFLIAGPLPECERYQSKIVEVTEALISLEEDHRNKYKKFNEEVESFAGWQLKFRGSLQVIEKNLEAAIERNSSFFFQLEKTQEINNKTEILRQKIDLLLNLPWVVSKLPGANKESFFAHFIYEVSKEEIKLIQRELKELYSMVVAAKHPMIDMYNTFVTEVNLKEAADQNKLINDAIDQLFSQSKEEVITLSNNSNRT